MCWADDLYAIAGTMNHLTRILEDMTNEIERLGMRWKKKVLPLLLDLSRSTNLAMLLRLSATMAYVGLGVWWKAWRRWERGWTIGDVQKASIVAQDLQSKLHVLREEGSFLRSQTASEEAY